jgi:hypothetical protein
MTIDAQDLVRFKTAFKGITAARETPLLAHKVAIPGAAGTSQRVLKILADLDDTLDQASGNALGKRTGKKVLGITVSSDKKSSLKQTSDAIGDEVDLDALSDITKGKGQQDAQDALQSIKDSEGALQTAIVEELLEQAKDANTLEDHAARIGDAFTFLDQPGIAVDGGHDAMVLSLAGLIAKKLGMTETDILSASADQIKAAYLDTIYAKLKMENKANRDPGILKTIQALIEKLSQIDPAKLTQDGEAAAFQAKVLTAKLGDTIALNGARAGKYSVGTQETRSRTLKSSSGQTSALKTQGNKLFSDAVSDALDKIGNTGAGKLLLDAVAATGKELTIMAPSVSSAQRVGQDGTTYYSNSAGNGRVALDPENDIAGEDAADDKIDTEKWRQRDASVALYHEMIHALIGNKGGEVWVSREDKDVTLKLGDQGEYTELRIVGLDYVDDKRGVTFPFSDPAYNPITENQFRIALAKKNGEKVAYLRPFYANVIGQVKLTTDKVSV